MVAGISRATIFSNSVLLMYSIEDRTVAIRTSIARSILGRNLKRVNTNRRTPRSTRVTEYGAERQLCPTSCGPDPRSLNQQRARWRAGLSGKTVAQILHDLIMKCLTARAPSPRAGELLDAAAQAAEVQ